MSRRENVRYHAAATRHLERLRGRGYADRTLYGHRHALTRLGTWITQHGHGKDPYLHTIGTSVVESFLYGPDGIRWNADGTERVGSGALNNQLNIMRQFFRHAHAEGWVEYDPTSTLKPARPEQKDPALILTPEELFTLVDRADNGRDRCAIAIGMNTGLRANDLKRLTVFDVNLAAGIATSIRKTKKIDVKVISSDLAPELVRWLDEYARRMGLAHRDELPNDWLLLPARKWNPNDPDGWTLNVHAPVRDPHVIVQKAIRALGYPTKKTGFHTLRRSAARGLFELLRDEEGSGRDHALMIAKAFLNHSTTAMTEGYLGLSQERSARDELLRGKPFLSRMVVSEPTAGVVQWRAG